jgi:hypothetical protein
MTALVSGLVDLEKPGRYPIVLSDALMGKGTKEVFTNFRCKFWTPSKKAKLKINFFLDNHKPEDSSEAELRNHKLRPSTNSNSDEYELSFSDGSGQYKYQGIRSCNDGQYVLIFDPDKKHFVLHQVDSSFNMNMTSAPWEQNADSLRATYDQLQLSPKPPKKAVGQSKSKALKESKTVAPTEIKRRKVEKPKKPKVPPRDPTPDAEDEDSDDGLTVEYPGGPPPARFPTQAPLPPPLQREEASEESDADAEYEEEDMERNKDVETLELPSPFANTVLIGEDPDVEEDEEVDLDLAAELEQALEKDESSESEEE